MTSNQVDPLNIEHWFNALQNYTFPTQFVDMTFSEAQALSFRQDDPTGKYKKYNKDVHDPIIHNLEQRIDQCIAALDCNAVFVRLSTRSPKDASLKNTEKVESLLRQAIENSAQQEDVEDPVERENNETLCLVHSFHQALRVNTGREAVDLILLSKRSYHDIFVRLLHQQTEEEFKMKIAIRAWVDIKPGMEFRAFVTNGRISVCSQYFQACFIREMYDRRDHWRQEIETLFQIVKPLLQHIPSYVIDFAVKSDDQLAVVELNHFEKTTGSALFDWNTEEDLIRGVNSQLSDPFEFRIIEGPVPNSMSSLYAPLRLVLEKVKSESLTQVQTQQEVSKQSDSFCSIQ